MKKCPECNELNDDSAQYCENCGYPILKDEKNSKDMMESENQNNANDYAIDNDSIDQVEIANNSKKRISTPVLFGCIAGVVFLCIVAIFIYMTSDLRKYQVANRYAKDAEYEKALELYTELEDYKDSKEKYVEVEHEYMVSTDDIPPTIENIPEEIRIKIGDSFNAEEWLSASNVTVADNVTQDIKYEVEAQGVDTSATGDYTISVKAVDEAGNNAVEEIPVTVYREYTQEEIAASANSAYEDGIPGLERIEYDKDLQTVWVFVVQEGMTEAAMMARMNASVKDSWNELTDSLDTACKSIYYQLLADGYTDISKVSMVLLNDVNTDNVLYTTVNGTKFFDVTDD